MKNLFALLLSAWCFRSAHAQDTVKAFSAYQFTIPNSQVVSKMVPIPAGSFLMGSSRKEKGRGANEGPQRDVTVSAFWMSEVEVTRDQFDAFYKDETTSANSAVDAVTRPSPQYIDFSRGMGKKGGYPVNSMSQHTALMYSRWLYQKTGMFYRLPTEAEWEYACRAGTTTRYYFGDDETQLDQYAWHKKNSGNKFQKTGLKLPNAWGLYDMLGNVVEWTLDHYDDKPLVDTPNKSKKPVVAPDKTSYPKVLKGGGFDEDASHLRCAQRFVSDPSWNRRDPQLPKSRWWLTDAPAVGFRIVRPLKEPSAAEAEEFYKKYLGK